MSDDITGQAEIVQINKELAVARSLLGKACANFAALLAFHLQIVMQIFSGVFGDREIKR